jgi:hypothetical protein
LRAREDSIAAARADSALRAVGAIPPGTSTRVGTPGLGATIVIGAGGGLVSGTASMRETIRAFKEGKLRFYDEAITMTTTSGWKR